MSKFYKLLLTLMYLSDAAFARNKVGTTNEEWIQLSSRVSFQRNTAQTEVTERTVLAQAEQEAMNRMLSSNEVDPSYTYQPLDSSTEYDEYQLAWHLLGYYVDCDSVQSYCSRYAMYAVYVNLDYEGGEIGEYYYYDANSGNWTCYNEDGCKSKMDCHLPDTHWKLLGVFKINNIAQGDGFMEQLFKHQGVCVWGEDTYKFASNMRKKMPKDCTSTKTTLENGDTLYYHIKPERQGNITLGLYTDSICSQEYTGTEFDVFELSGYDESYFIMFNEALDTWKQCQPCISHNLNYYYNDFSCYDDAGYTNCNQCMKFSNKAGCTIATIRDVEFAARQKALVAFELYGGTYGNGGIGRTDRGDVAYHDLAEYDAKPMLTPQEHLSVALPFSFVFLLIGAVVFAKATIKNFKEYSRMKERINRDDIMSRRTEKLIQSMDSKKKEKRWKSNTSFDDEKAIKDDAFTPCTIPDSHMDRFVKIHTDPIIFDNEYDQEVASALSRISTRGEQQAEADELSNEDDRKLI